MSAAHSSAITLPDSALFKRRVVGISYAVSVPGLAIIIGFLLTLLDLTHDEWIFFFTLVGVYAVGISFPMVRMQTRIFAPITHYLDRCEEPGASDAERHAAFARIVDLPRQLAYVGGLGWVVPCIVLSLVMVLRFRQFSLAEAGVIALAGIAAGFVSASFMVFLVKREVESVRARLAFEIPDPGLRQGLVRRISLRTKILACVTGVTSVPVIFAVAMSFAKASDALEEFTIRWQRQVLASVEERLPRQGLDAALVDILGSQRTLAAPLEVAVIDLVEDERGNLIIEANLLESLGAMLDDGIESGSSSTLPSDRVFAWRALDDGRILVASSPKEALTLDLREVSIALGLLVAIASAVSFALAWLVSTDVSRATVQLREEAERLSSGDLRRVRVLESEDELGELSRSFEAMAMSLSATISRVAEAADRVEATGSDLSAVSKNVTGVTVDQVSGIQRASTSMEEIHSQVRGIADLSQALNRSVEESSSSILELGASGQDLNDTAATLSAKVDEVSSSIEQMVRSVNQVAENTESLGQASEETSSSMEEMAVSLKQVEVTAAEAAQLSNEVVSSAESGQAKVSQTIEGMDAIRIATETAEKVIRNLGGRTKEIGTIIGVIDDVADETNLLALNAAIIAAQAGEHGKAFSVVADEIKDLADRVLASTKEIGGLIRAVQEESANAIGAIERGTQSVASGVDLSAEAGVSLEGITRASRESGTRIAGIVNAVREQVLSASHVVELMARVRTGVDEIRSAANEQGRGNTVVYRSATTMREVAQQVRGTTEEQARGSGRLRESAEEIREAVEQINNALQEQSAACQSAFEFLEDVFARTRSNEDSARRMDAATQSLMEHAAGLRADVHRFRI